ncbi:MAG TPA: DHHA1 domain-containing protein, partial [Armatimonadota bacterium]|nr:DHHA1 domain-containing protein [Armatimonadota bacterium]
ALQSGSVVEPGRLRFDFSHFQAVTPEEIQRIEDEVNDKILADLPVEIIETTVDEARKMGAMALFGEKYGERVRVMKVGDYSIELCGGTHLNRTSQIGFFKIISESSIGAGLRRIEAVTGHGAVQHVHDLEDLLNEISEKVGVSKLEAASAIERLQASLKEAQKKIEQLQAKSAATQAEELSESAQEVAGVKLVTSKVATANPQVMSALADSIADRLRSVVVVLGGVSDGKVLFVGKVTPDLVQKGLHAGNLLREVAKVAGGGGGGRPEFAQAGGKNPEKVDEALEKAAELVKQQAGV